jgi:hypothetical protein
LIGALLTLACGLALSGCDAEPPEPPPAPEPAADLAVSFDTDGCGTLTGRVLWDGPHPQVPAYRGALTPRTEAALGVKHTWPNPHAPAIGDENQVNGAVIFLRGIDPRRSRPWDHPPVRVELRDYQMHLLQGNHEVPCGFVRRGEEVEMASRQKGFYHSIEARGAAFFMAPFPDPDQAQRRRLGHRGVVDLSSGCGCFWMARHLFVDDHPYYALTDADGHFTLAQVPVGRYRLVCWLPDWRPKVRELDADTWGIASIQYQPPLTISQEVQVGPGETWAVDFSFSAAKCGVPND